MRPQFISPRLTISSNSIQNIPSGLHVGCASPKCSKMSSTIPSITGSCLCKSIAFTISFPPSSSWPPGNNASCQCSNCRKFTGALVPQSFQVPTEDIHPELASFETYRTFDSGPESYRGFCVKCGSSLTHNDETGFTEVWLGCIDVEFLAGQNEGTVIKTDFGSMQERSGGLGKELCTAKGHFWMCNAITGTTDQMTGPKYWANRADGQPFSGDLTTLWDRLKRQQ